MKPWHRKTLGVLGAAAVIHVAVVWALPRLIVAVVRHRLTSVVGVNHIQHAELPTSTWRTVVMPSPDQLYSACAYDLSEHPLLITAEVPAGYWSVSAFADDTDNFFVLDDRATTDHRARIVLTESSDSFSDPSATMVRAPTKKGVVLFRLLLLDKADLGELSRIQRAAKCEPLVGPATAP